MGDENLSIRDIVDNLRWDGENAMTSLNVLYGFAYKEAESTEAWYWKKTGQKKQWAMILRVVAIASATVAGLIPILTPIFKDSAGDPLINPVWSSVAVGLGTAAIGLDKYFGFSSGWIRYVTSAMNVKGWLIEFKYDWELNRAMSLASGNTYDNAELQAMIMKCSAFVSKILGAVQGETKQWAQEFQSSLGTLDEALKQQAAVNQPSSVIINLENGDACKQGWEVRVNGRSLGKHFGKTGAVMDLYPGLYQVVIIGKVTKKELHAETAVKVESGQVASVTLKLT